MKKLMILLISIILLTGCGKNQNKDNVDKSSVTQQELKKIDEGKEKVFFTTYRNLMLDNEPYELLIPTINLNSQDVANVNLEMKSFVGGIYTNLSLDGTNILSGNIISYDTYYYENYITIKQKYAFYYDDKYMSNYSNIYVIDYDMGKLINNEELLKKYDLSEEELFNYLSEHIDSLEVEYIIMNIKSDGYKLYINDDGKLVINYLERDNDDEKEKELIYN